MAKTINVIMEEAIRETNKKLPLLLNESLKGKKKARIQEEDSNDICHLHRQEKQLANN